MNEKQNKGITLIALVITIIILLILAMVSINLVMNSGIISRAEKGVGVYSEEETKEKIQLAYSDYQMGKLNNENYTFEQALTVGGVDYKSVTGSDAEGYIVTVETKKGEKQYTVSASGIGAVKTLEDYGVQIGDYVNYDKGTGTTYTTDTTKGVAGSVGTKNSSTGKYPLTSKTYTTENLNWRVLGVNSKGELELISDNPHSVTLYLANEEGYLYGADELNRMCDELYGKGEYATGARSLNVEDINNLIDTGYNPKTYSGYGEKWTYKYPTNEEVSEYTEKGLTRNIWYRIDNPDGTEKKDWAIIASSSYYKTFRMPGEETIGEISDENIKEGTAEPLEHTYYSYDIVNNITDSKISDMITKGKSSSTVNQWLASHCVRCGASYADFCVRRVNNGSVSTYSLYYSHDSGDTINYRVRPVVTLSSNVQIDTSDSSKDGSTYAKAYKLKVQ